MNYQNTILSALIPRNQAEKPTADEALKIVFKNKVTANHFTGYYKYLFELIAKQSNRTSILDMELLTAYLDTSEYKDEHKAEIKILFTSCRERFTVNDKLDVICAAFIEEQNFISFSQALINTGEILSQGKKFGKLELKGLAAAKKFFIDKISSLQGALDSSFPSMSVAEAVPNFWEDYERKEQNPGIGLMTGLTEVDRLTNGFDPGEFVLVAAAYGEGKSTLLRNFAYHAAYRQKKNVVYYTLEMPLKQIERELISLHSVDPKFSYPKGLTSSDIQRACLKPEERALLRVVTDDLQNNIHTGIFKIVQLPNNATVSTIRENMMYLQNEFQLDAIYIDYAALLTSELLSCANPVEKISDTIRKIKNLANTFNNGQSITVINAHQISREARMRVDKSEDKRYDRSFLSDTSETEKSADTILWSLRTEDMERAHELKMGVAKNRRGPKMPDWFVREDFRCGHVTSIYQPMAKNRESVYDL